MSLVEELAKLDELRRRGALTDAEFTKAKAALLGAAPAGPAGELGEHLADQLAEVRYQNELAQLDREWQNERQQYLIRGRYGVAQVPTPGMGIGMAVVVGMFGMFWTILAVSLTSGGPNDGVFAIAKVIFPLFGVLFTVAGIAVGVNAYSKGQKYQEAYAAYTARRAQVKREHTPSADRPPDHGPSSHDIKPA